MGTWLHKHRLQPHWNSLVGDHDDPWVPRRTRQSTVDDIEFLLAQTAPLQRDPPLTLWPSHGMSHGGRDDKLGDIWRWAHAALGAGIMSVS
jgi:hypothetical protein